MPMSLPPIAGAPPGAPPLGAPPTGSQPPADAPPSPLGPGTSIKDLLMLLAGAGIKPLIESITKLQPKPPKTGVKADTAGSGGMSMAPALAAILAKSQANSGGLPIQ